MGRTLALLAVPVAVVAWSWLRLERSPDGLDVALVLALALAPALAPTGRRRVLAATGAAVLAVPYVALDERLRHAGVAASRFARGLGDFYDVTLPFAPAERAMHGVLLVALFAFVLALGLAVAARRTGLALVVLLVGAGWPATLLAGTEALRGAAILAAALWLLAAQASLRPLVLGAAVVVAAALAAGSGGVARGGLVDWRAWRVSSPQEQAVSLAYVWQSDYRGLQWPDHETTVLHVRGPARSLYWRAATLDAYDRGRWLERPLRLRDPLADPLLPARARDHANWLLTTVESDALLDTHLPAPGTPVAVGGHRPALFSSSGVRVPPLRHGDAYDVSTYAPDPTPPQLAGAGRAYPNAAARYLAVDRDAAALRPRALAVTRRTRNPYTAALALEDWFRRTGGFRYDEHPPAATGGRSALVDFVLRTRRGYCQHFAGAMALMLRSVGVPARVAVGFTSGTYDASTREWTVTDHDAHAWVEAWFPRWGWIPFDPTPGRGELAGAYTSASVYFDAKAATVATGLAQHARAHPELVGPRQPTAGRAAASRTNGLLIAFVLGAVAAAAALVAAKRLARRLAYLRAGDARAVALTARRELAAFAADQRIDLPAGSTVGELVPRLAPLGVDATAFARAATAAAYGPSDRAERAAADARRELRALIRALRRQLPLSRRVRGALSLRSL